MSFSEKVVIVTGASSGIGAAIAIKFAEQRAAVVLVARNEKRLKEVAEKCNKYGSKTTIVIADVTKENETKQIVETTIAQYGKIDILINNAGFVAVASICDPEMMDAYDSMMTTNLRSAVYLTHLAVPHLLKSKGNIINMSSIAAYEALSVKTLAYCTSKAAMNHFSRCVALDLGPKGVRVNTVNPGPVRTSFGGGHRGKDVWDKWAVNTSLKRVSDPEEVGDLVLFLASEKAKGITGSSFTIDNGTMLVRNLK